MSDNLDCIRIFILFMREIPKPKVTDVPDGRGVLVKVLRVSVDGTDKEINAAEYGTVPPGDDFLIIGHESFGIVEEAGSKKSCCRIKWKGEYE
ncbi:MAG: alcohol dehydrogenase catalytic domain-containing protein [Planctomycetes bacterium]|nr:alcohol dehydrogenase catalytic domain-containing protein [Planctomycetota bacterium]